MPHKQYKIEGVVDNEGTEVMLNNGLTLEVEDFLYELEDFIQEASDGNCWLDDGDKITIMIEKQA